jgi:hypothetical protein
MISVSFSQILGFHRKELATFKEVNKKNMIVVLKVLAQVRKTSWPYGMAYI